jgi:hypothetical protein
MFRSRRRAENTDKAKDTSATASTYRWCDACRRSFAHEDSPDGVCPVCAKPTREMGKFGAIARGLMANELSMPDLRAKHRQLIRLTWTRNGMGERYYKVIAPEVAYPKFEAEVTGLLMRGAEEGWVRFVFPPAPSADESLYRVEFDDEERFVNEMAALFEKPGGSKGA